MYGVIVSLMIVVAILLILVVLAQNPKGGGLSSQFGGSGGAQVMGVKKTSDLLEKLTWYFAIAILVMALSTQFFVSSAENQTQENPLIESVQDDVAIPNPILESPEGGQKERQFLILLTLLNNTLTYCSDQKTFCNRQ